MSHTVWLVDLEAVPTRYTGQWKTYLPKQIGEFGHQVEVIEGRTDIPEATTPGAFLNFGGTNIYKANQVERMGELFTQGDVKSGDTFLFLDAWHPGVINLKYMSELLGIPVKIVGLWHAGSYDPNDFLGRIIGDADWVRYTEKAMFNAYDVNCFATDFHIEMFYENLWHSEERMANDLMNGKTVRVGWPMEYLKDELAPYRKCTKSGTILFPHRIAPEKQVEIFKDLAQHLPEYKFVVCQEQELTKAEYHKLLGEADMVFSANLQETLGISCYEGVLTCAEPLVPDRLSYTEMYPAQYRYPSEWTANWDSYLAHREDLIDRIQDVMTKNRHDVDDAEHKLSEEFFSGLELYRQL